MDDPITCVTLRAAIGAFCHLLCLAFHLGPFFRIVLIGRHVILEAVSRDQTLSTSLDPLATRISSAYRLIACPQFARMMR